MNTPRSSKKRGLRRRYRLIPAVVTVLSGFVVCTLPNVSALRSTSASVQPHLDAPFSAGSRCRPRRETLVTRRWFWGNQQPQQREQKNHTPTRPLTQVISDVDDTLKSSGGVNVAGVALGGIDVQYPRGAYYPGVAEFMLHLSLGPHFYNLRSQDTNVQQPPPPPLTPAKVAILTARAEEFKLALELKADNPLSIALAQAGQAVGVTDWGIGPVLYGSVAEWIVQDRKGLRKFTNFERLIQQDPTHGALLQYVYVGDTGELDQQAGETMLREYPQIVKAVFLHAVSGIRNDVVPIPPVKLINGRPIVFFRTYVGAAVAAVQLGLMCETGLEKVVYAACLSLRDEPQSSDKWMDLKRDIDHASKLVHPRQLLERSHAMELEYRNGAPLLES
jgi:hypothetical protein